MSASRSIDLLPPTMTPPWTRPLPLPDKPGGETNLLHRDAWATPANPLRVEFKPWYDSPSPIRGSEKVDVFLDDNESNIIGTRTWTLPMEPAEYFIEITADKLPQGEHQISFIMTNYLDVKARSFPYTVTIDKQVPLLNAASRLTFPAEVLPPNKLTARYLDLNADQVKANLPVYTAPRPWDRITWYWGATPGSQEQGGVIELDDKNFSAPVVITVPGDLIRSRGDGMRYVWYQVHDRAGNASLRSDFVELNVAATPIPRSLPPSKIKEATGGTSSGTLNPLNAINGVTAIIPSEAVIYDGERVFVQWAEQGSEGHYRTATPITPGGREYKIPSDKIGYHVNRSLPVSYEVFESGVVEPHTSQSYTLKVDRLTGLPTIQCDKVSGGKLSLATIPAGGYANFTLGRWTFMGTEQFLTIMVRGVSSSNSQIDIPVLTDYPVPEVAQVISVGRISKTDLQRLKIGAGFEVRVRVSFDDKETWQTFPSLTPTLMV